MRPKGGTKTPEDDHPKNTKNDAFHEYSIGEHKVSFDFDEGEKYRGNEEEKRPTKGRRL